ncbi:DegT/DnrJ/EryC1/StrS family aminotransferase [Dasania marina]|uniref:DegT/DnrJ/EryC1/StrS family aminotransferase n=1 Tax=Dasania marina TaxID=471499 RepID=UPI00037E9B32|nr:DegT/DnrJ/EryC1/StrS family aminotransferase [Dasania marina]
MNAGDFLPFALPDIGEDEINEVVDSLRSGWVTTGPKVKKFEEDFEGFLGERSIHAIAVNSATSGLHLALEALGVGPGDEVIVPTYTFTASAEVVRYLGATPVFVDVDPSTYNLTTSLFEAAITGKTKAVIPVHFAGLACDMDGIIKVAKKHFVKVVEDAAHALPSIYNERLVGTLDTDFTVFSFYANKTMTTGEGGMVVTSNDELAKRCKVMRLHGINKDIFNRYRSNVPSWFYEVVAPGYKYNMTDIAASIGIHQLKRLAGFQNRREYMASRYNKELKGLPVLLPAEAEVGCTHAWHLYTLRLSEQASITRDKFIQMMLDKGIGCSVHFIPLHLHPYWRDTYKLTPEMFPAAERIFKSIVSIPLYTKMTDADQTRVISTIKRIFSDA